MAAADTTVATPMRPTRMAATTALLPREAGVRELLRAMGRRAARERR
jgi:hypothetical protein